MNESAQARPWVAFLRRPLFDRRGPSPSITNREAEEPAATGDNASSASSTARSREALLLKEELDLILGVDHARTADRELIEQSLWGLAFSGGGIRSATFGLGVLQALAKRNWLGGFHYLSTVSGGGYIGAYLQGLIERKGGVEAASDELRSQTGGTIRELRCFSNFLTPDKATFSADRATFVSVYVGNLLLTQVQLIAWLMLFLSAPLAVYIAFAYLSMYPLAGLLVSLALTIGSMYLRGRFQFDSENDDNSGKEPLKSRWGPAAMLFFAIVALTPFLLGSNECRITTNGCSLIPGIPLSSQNARILGALLVYLSGFATWMGWWLRIQAARNRRLAQQLANPDAPVADSSTARPDQRKILLDRRERLGRHVAGVVVGVITLWCALTGLFFRNDIAPWKWTMDRLMREDLEQQAYTWWSLVIGVPVVFAVIFCVSTLHIGIAFFTAGDRLSRERWSRILGRGALCLLAFSGLVMLVAIGPWLVGWIANKISLPGEGWAVPLLSIASSALGARVAYFDGQRGTSTNWFIRQAMAATVALAPILLVIGVLLLNAMLVQALLNFAIDHDTSISAYLSQVHSELIPPQHVAAWVITLLGIWFVGYVLSFLIDENECSMNGFYRNRIVRCYLAPSSKDRRGDPETDQDPAADDMFLRSMRNANGKSRPLYPLVCAAANMTATSDLDWQDRRAASFIFSPLFCGHVPPKRRVWTKAKFMGDLLPLANTNGESLADSITLGTAIATSGAAVSPNMGYHSSPAITFLLTLFNARLGWWVENFNVPKSPRRFFSQSKLLLELLSRTRDTAPYTYVSDGGHFENLGIYELVRRKCRFILCVDASADPDRDFDSLGNAIHKCRVDFGASIDIDVSLMRPDSHGVSKRGAVLGRINYGDCTGLLLYVKPSITGGETADIARYASAHGEFPHEPTRDQFFDEHQFEAYRQLGSSMGDRIFSLGGEQWELVRAGRKNEIATELNLVSNTEKEALLLRLEHWLFEPSDATALRFTTHGAALCRLLERQRTDNKLHSLDGQLNAGWSKAGGHPEALQLPDGTEFRPCFYFVQEVIQLMEAVYLDLDLERNFNHPDNRGWMNLFRQWTWVPMFRVVWALTSQSLGSRFVHFCEEALGAPRVEGALRMEWSEAVTDVKSLAAQLHAAGDISIIEKEVLTSACVADALDRSARMDIGRLKIDWDELFECAGLADKLEDLDVGLVVAISKEGEKGMAKDADAPLRKIIVGRVQDHVRRMGFGAQMIYLALDGERRSIDEADVAATNYGATIGTLAPSTATRQRKELRNMLKRARRRRGLSPQGRSHEEEVATT